MKSILQPEDTIRYLEKLIKDKNKSLENAMNRSGSTIEELDNIKSHIIYLEFALNSVKMCGVFKNN